MIARRVVLTDVAAERGRQAWAEGYTSGHDDEHDRGELARAGAAYALAASGFRDVARNQWPWDSASFKTGRPGVGWRRRCLVKAMALLCAEVERLDRAEASS